MKLLHIDSAITGDGSVSRKLTADIVARLREGDPALETTYRDLAAEPLGHLTLADLPAAEQTTPVLEEFLAADVVVVGAPMYNFNVSSQLKAWIDRILVAGRTFRYGEAGPVGLAGDKRVIVAVSRGGFYGADTGRRAAEHAETYLTTVFGFIGVTPEFVIAEGILVGPEQRDAAIAQADQAIGALAA
ncbi:FMN-dependent NADH-azoreductase [Brevundimonas sp. M20]|uniref:FMN-dependent NADH-azoreductase n=1 Tax=Brevundimonas sp. M20 TaxID=2591463 RepID=UPI00114764F4|nr:NAD(P)H-dependent oxidoreductase [Brevundimonas sp. M20]QDH73529.1 FMN-dependent NADH-azoreductase [Brevundimonas sp. M20]